MNTAKKNKREEIELANFQKRHIISKYNESLRTGNFKSFCSFIEIQSETDGKMLFDFDKWREPQKLFENQRCKKDVVLKPRRIGFTTMELIRDLFYAFTHGGSFVCLVAQEEKLGNRMIFEIQKIYSNLEKLEKKLAINGELPKLLPAKGPIWSANQLTFENGSEIFCEIAKAHEASAERTGRGISINRLHCTEVAFWTYADLTMKSLMTAASNAEEIIIESTPNGASGYFYELFWRIEQGEVPEWKNHFYPWHSMKSYRSKMLEKETINLTPENFYEEILINKYHIEPEQLKWWRAKVAISGLNTVVQEFPIDVETCFRTKSSTFLEQADFIYLSSCIAEPIDTLFFEHCFGIPLKIWKHPESRNGYVIGADVSYGIKQDYSTAFVIDHITGDIAASYTSNEIKPAEFAALLKEIANYYNGAMIAVEGIGPGRSTIQELESTLNYSNLYRAKDAKQYGWNTTGLTRVNLFNLYQQIINQKEVRIVDQDLVNEARTLIIKDNRVDHAKGATSDRTFAFMIGQMVRREYKRNLSENFIYASSKSQMQNSFSFGRPRFK